MIGCVMLIIINLRKRAKFKMSEGYLSVIEQLITENETLKSINRKLTNLCENVLDEIVDIFSQFFPTILPYDSDCIFKAGEEICTYYRKQLIIVKSQLCKNLLHLLNFYGMQVDNDLEDISFDNLGEFLGVMRSGKGNLIEELALGKSKVNQLQTQMSNIQKELNTKLLELKKLSIQVQDKQSFFHQLNSNNQLLMLEIKNLKNQLDRAHDNLQNVSLDHDTILTQLNQLKTTNEELRRQILYLEEQKMEKIFLNKPKV